jgi:hypothetical protein
VQRLEVDHVVRGHVGAGPEEVGEHLGEHLLPRRRSLREAGLQRRPGIAREDAQDPDQLQTQLAVQPGPDRGERPRTAGLGGADRVEQIDPVDARVCSPADWARSAAVSRGVS